MRGSLSHAADYHSISFFLLVGKSGTQVIVPYRDEDAARVFKPMGDLGQIVRMVFLFFFSLSPRKDTHLSLTVLGMGYSE